MRIDWNKVRVEDFYFILRRDGSNLRLRQVEPTNATCYGILSGAMGAGTTLDTGRVDFK